MRRADRPPRPRPPTAREAKILDALAWGHLTRDDVFERLGDERARALLPAPRTGGS